MEEEGLVIARSISWLQWYQLKVLCGNTRKACMHLQLSLYVQEQWRAHAHMSGLGRADGWRKETGYVGCVVVCISWMDGWAWPWVGGMQIGSSRHELSGCCI